MSNRIALAIYIPCLLILSACFSTLPMTGSGMISGGSFSDHLANEYTNLAVFEEQYMNNTAGADHFKTKARRVSRGQAVMPDRVGGRRIPAFAVDELSRARQQLTDALNTMNTSSNGPLLALAQSRFDCWLAHQEQYPVRDAYISCKMFFYDAMSLLTAPVNRSVNDLYAVYFESGKIQLSEESKVTLRQVADIMASHVQWDMTLTGFTDSKGNMAQNKQLAMRRAMSVRNYLIQNGVSHDNIHISAEGGISDSEDAAYDRRVEIDMKPSYVANNQSSGKVAGWQHMGDVN